MKYINIDERYGDQVEATIDDYKTLNPTGNFIEREDGIYEGNKMVAVSPPIVDKI